MTQRVCVEYPSYILSTDRHLHTRPLQTDVQDDTESQKDLVKNKNLNVMHVSNTTPCVTAVNVLL